MNKHEDKEPLRSTIAVTASVREELNSISKELGTKNACEALKTLINVYKSLDDTFFVEFMAFFNDKVTPVLKERLEEEKVKN